MKIGPIISGATGMVGEGVLLELAGDRGRPHSIAASFSKSHYERHRSDGWYCGSPKDPACRSTPIQSAKVEALLNPIRRYHRPHPRRRVSVNEAVLDERATTAERFEQVNATYRGDRR